MRADRLSVDQFISEPALELYAQRFATGADTIQAVGLAETSITIGGFGLAAYGLGSKESSDVDLVVPEEEFERMAASWCAQRPRETHNGRELHFPESQKALPLTLLRSPFSYNVTNHLNAGTFNDLERGVLVVNGVRTLSAGRLALSKVRRAEDGDFADLARAQVVGWATGCKAINEVVWKSALKMALHTIELKNTAPRKGLFRSASSLPPWLGHLASTHFDHPAFRPILEFEMPKMI